MSTIKLLLTNYEKSNIVSYRIYVRQQVAHSYRFLCEAIGIKVEYEKAFINLFIFIFYLKSLR